MELEEYFGAAVIDKIRDHIKVNYLGQAPLYTSFVIQTGHPIIKYLVYTATYITKKSEPLSAYYSTWSALVAIQTFNRANQNAIQQFVSRGFQIGDSEEESARQMWLAYYNFMYPPADPTPDYMATLEDVLTNTDRIFPEERKAFFLEQLVSGEIERRGFMDENGYEYCVTLFTQLNSLWENELSSFYDDKKMKKLIRNAAGKAIVRYTWPDEFLPGSVDKFLDRSMLKRLLKLVAKGAAADAPTAKKPKYIKAGIKHVTHLVEQKEAKLVIIAHDVDPIEIVLWLPTLCRKKGVPYLIVKGKARLGKLVHKKTASCLAVTDIDQNRDSNNLSLFVEKANDNFNNRLTDQMKTPGGGIMGSKHYDRKKKEDKRRVLEQNKKKQ